MSSRKASAPCSPQRSTVWLIAASLVLLLLISVEFMSAQYTHTSLCSITLAKVRGEEAVSCSYSCGTAGDFLKLHPPTKLKSYQAAAAVFTGTTKKKKRFFLLPIFDNYRLPPSDQETQLHYSSGWRWRSNWSKNVFTYRFVHITALLLPDKLKYKNSSFLKSNANMANVTVWQTHLTNVHKTWAKKIYNFYTCPTYPL